MIDENKLSRIIIGKCIKIHSLLVPGLLESVSEEVLSYELKEDGLKCKRQLELPVLYDNMKMDIGFRVDLLVEDKVIIEIKSIETVLPIHKKQLLTYLKLSKFKLGLLINFNEELIKNGIIRIINNL